jgi:hypothetical protein
VSTFAPRLDGMNPPTLWARVNESGFLRVYCPYCRHEHYHGRVAGHLQAHCTRGPWKYGAYVIEIKPGASAADVQAHNTEVIRG